MDPEEPEQPPERPAAETAQSLDKTKEQAEKAAARPQSEKAQRQGTTQHNDPVEDDDPSQQVGRAEQDHASEPYEDPNQLDGDQPEDLDDTAITDPVEDVESDISRNTQTAQASQDAAQNPEIGLNVTAADTEQSESTDTLALQRDEPVEDEPVADDGGLAIKPIGDLEDDDAELTEGAQQQPRAADSQPVQEIDAAQQNDEPAHAQLAQDRPNDDDADAIQKPLEDEPIEDEPVEGQTPREEESLENDAEEVSKVLVEAVVDEPFENEPAEDNAVGEDDEIAIEAAEIIEGDAQQSPRADREAVQKIEAAQQDEPAAAQLAQDWPNVEEVDQLQTPLEQASVEDDAEEVSEVLIEAVEDEPLEDEPAEDNAVGEDDDVAIEAAVEIMESDAEHSPSDDREVGQEIDEAQRDDEPTLSVLAQDRPKAGEADKSREPMEGESVEGESIAVESVEDEAVGDDDDLAIEASVETLESVDAEDMIERDDAQPPGLGDEVETEDDAELATDAQQLPSGAEREPVQEMDAPQQDDEPAPAPVAHDRLQAEADEFRKALEEESTEDEPVENDAAEDRQLVVNTLEEPIEPAQPVEQQRVEQHPAEMIEARQAQQWPEDIEQPEGDAQQLLAAKWADTIEETETRLKESLKTVADEVTRGAMTLEGLRAEMTARQDHERQVLAAQRSTERGTPSDDTGRRGDIAERHEDAERDLEIRHGREQGAMRQLAENISHELRAAVRDVTGARRDAEQDAAVESAQAVLEARAWTVREQVRAAELSEAASRDPERQIDLKALRDLNERLAGEIAPYKELKQLTLEHNAQARRLYELTPGTLEYTGVRLDAEHFVDARFFAFYEKEFKQLGINSAADMPAFAVQTEYHLRNLTSLSAEAGGTPLQGSSLTQEKLEFIPTKEWQPRTVVVDGNETVSPKLSELLNRFKEFWSQKGTFVNREGKVEHRLSSYALRVGTKLQDMIDRAIENEKKL